jgi:hypothetical protein
MTIFTIANRINDLVSLAHGWNKTRGSVPVGEYIDPPYPRLGIWLNLYSPIPLQIKFQLVC